MASSPKKKLRRENTCSYCLYYHPEPTGKRPWEGNCGFHKEWIEKANFTTCSEMAEAKLEEKGIFSIISVGDGSWIYVRRSRRIRTRLYPVVREKREKGTK